MEIFQNAYPVMPRAEEARERSWFEDARTAWNITDLQKGEGVELASMENTFSQYPDYKDNEQFYTKYADMSKWYRSKNSDDLEREFIDKAIDEGKFALDNEGNLIAGENASPISMYLFDNDAVKGGLLARRNGWSKEVSDKAYANETARRAKELADEIKGASTSAVLLGSIANYAADPITAIEIATSPAKIVGATIAGGMAKAFVAEFAIGAFTETLREKQTHEHMARANLDYTLWDSAKNILIGAGLAGTIRGIGSGVYDANILRKINSSKLQATDKEIMNRYLRREQYKLTTNSRANIELLHKAEEDINKGKKVDVSSHTDIDINTRTDEAIEEFSIPDEISKINKDIGIQKDIDEIHKHVDDIIPIDDDIYKGMTTSQEADELFDEISMIDPEIKAELDAIKVARAAIKKTLSAQAERVSDAKEVPIGGSEDEAAEAVKNLFRKNKSEEARYKSMSKEDIAELERMEKEDLKYSKPPDMSDEDWEEANAVFAKGLDNLSAGVIAGVEEDEQGNITLDPAKFVAGFGGYSFVKAMLKSKQVQGKLREYTAMAIDDIEETMAKAAGGGTPPLVVPERKQGENLIAYAKRKKEFYDQYPELKPKTVVQKEIIKPKKSDIEMKFNALTNYENYTEGMKNTIIEKPFNTPKVKIYRGESENSGQGAAMFGSGLYTTTDKNLAKKYGKVREVSVNELPKNPIQFKTELDFKQFEYELSKELGIDKRDMVEYIGNIDEYLKKMGYDGMSVGAGKDAFFVTFPKRDN